MLLFGPKPHKLHSLFLYFFFFEKKKSNKIKKKTNRLNQCVIHFQTSYILHVLREHTFVKHFRTNVNSMSLRYIALIQRRRKKHWTTTSIQVHLQFYDLIELILKSTPNWKWMMEFLVKKKLHVKTIKNLVQKSAVVCIFVIRSTFYTAIPM